MLGVWCQFVLITWLTSTTNTPRFRSCTLNYTTKKKKHTRSREKLDVTFIFFSLWSSLLSFSHVIIFTLMHVSISPYIFSYWFYIWFDCIIMHHDLNIRFDCMIVDSKPHSYFDLPCRSWTLRKNQIHVSTEKEFKQTLFQLNRKQKLIVALQLILRLRLEKSTLKTMTKKS